MSAPDRTVKADERPWLIRALVANPWQKVASLTIAASVWLYVQGEEIQDARLMAQIAWNLPNDLLPDDPLPTSASITVRGTRADLRRARAAALRVVVDLSERGRGDHDLEVPGSAAEGLPSGLEVVSIAPSLVHVTLDEVSVARVKLEASRVGDPAEGFQVDSLILDPKVVEVRGPRSAMTGLRQVTTRPIDVSGLAVSTVRPVVLDLPRGVSVVNDVSVSARIEVASTIEERRFENVPVYVWGDPAWKVTPPRITVVLEGPADGLASVTLDDLAAFAHLPDPAGRDRYEAWLADGTGVRVEVMHPGRDGVKVVSITPPSIVVERSR